MPVASRVMLVTARHPIAAALLALMLGCTLAACGGASEEDDREEIAATLRASLTTRDAAAQCGELLSSGLVTRVYGSAERCLAVETRSAPTRVTPTGVLVSDVRVDGDRATATLALRGNAQDRVRGAVGLVRQDGGWRLDDLSTAFLRTSFNAGLESGGTLEGALVVCVGRKIAELEDPALRTVLFGLMGGRPQARAQLNRMAADCVAALDDPAAGESA